MALDNANFIAELSIVDPPGSDPLSQGDDQIRTIKRATQQSFPNIDAAVTLTPIQLNLAAIKNEANVFTADQTLLDVNLFINQAIDSPKAIIWQLAGIIRWQFRFEDAANGNTMSLQRHDVLGAFVDKPWECDLVTGIVDFAQVPTVQGAPLWVAGELRMFVANTTPGTNWFVADGTNGTVNLDNRVLMAEGTSAAGTNLNPNLVGSLSASASGSTAITEAQMPVHAHDPWVSNDQGGGITDIGLNALTVWGFGGRRNDNSRHYDNRRSGGLLINPAGSGAGHTHSIAQGVVENGTSRDTVRPLSRTVQYHQYVP